LVDTSVVTIPERVKLAPACVTVYVKPDMVNDPVWAAAFEFAAYVNSIRAFPVPLVLPADNCNQEALLLAVQAPLANNNTLALPAALPTSTEDAPKLEVEGATMVRVNVTLSALTLAVTVNVPPVPLAVSVGAVALPLAFVRTGMAGVVLNVPLAPLLPEVTLNVTGQPDKGFPPASVRHTWRAVAKGWPTGVLWPFPAHAVKVAPTSPLCVTVTWMPRTVMCAERLVLAVLMGNEKPMTPPAMPVTVNQD
jgi:hypothetical protein